MIDDEGGIVRIVEHDPDWARRAERALRRLRAALGGMLLRADHIGSTAVPGLAAKPVLDLLLEVSDVQALDARAAALERLGYEARGEHGLPGRRFFRRADPVTGERVEHLQAWGRGDPALDRHRALRDFLRTFPDRAAAYGAHKIAVAERSEGDALRYQTGKADLLRALEADALEWFRRRNP